MKIQLKNNLEFVKKCPPWKKRVIFDRKVKNQLKYQSKQYWPKVLSSKFRGAEHSVNKQSTTDNYLCMQFSKILVLPIAHPALKLHTLTNSRVNCKVYSR